MNHRPSTNHHASLSIEDLVTSNNNHQQNWLLSYLDVFVLIVMLVLTLMALNDFNTEQRPEKTEKKNLTIINNTEIQDNLIKPIPDPIRPQPDITIEITEEITEETTDNLVDVIKTVEQETTALNKTQPPPSLITEAKADKEEIDLTRDLNSPAENTLPSQPAKNQLQQQLKKTISTLELADTVNIKVTQGYAQLEIQDKILFKSSEAKLLGAGEILLKKLAPLLEQSLGLIYIEGHTDNRPIKTIRFPSNWELGAARATSVLHYLVTQHIASSRLRAITYGDTKPIADNSTEEGRGKNRRVSITIKVSEAVK